MTLALPQSWDDVKKFVEEGGYLTLFDEKVQEGKREPFLEDEFLKFVNGATTANTEQAEWLKAWVRIASIPDILESEIPRIFFEIAWRIYSGEDAKALKVLQRYQKGGIPLSNWPDFSSPKQTHLSYGTAAVFDPPNVPSGFLDRQGNRCYSPLSSVSDEHEHEVEERPAAFAAPDKDNQSPREIDTAVSQSHSELLSHGRVTRKKSSSGHHTKGLPDLHEKKVRHSRRLDEKQQSSTARRSLHHTLSTELKNTKEAQKRSMRQRSTPDASSTALSPRAARATARNNKRLSSFWSKSIDGQPKPISHSKIRKSVAPWKKLWKAKNDLWKRLLERRASLRKRKAVLQTSHSTGKNIVWMKRKQALKTLWNPNFPHPQPKTTPSGCPQMAAAESVTVWSGMHLHGSADINSNPPVFTENNIHSNHAGSVSSKKRRHPSFDDQALALDNDPHDPPSKKRRFSSQDGKPERNAPMTVSLSSQPTAAPREEVGPPLDKDITVHPSIARWKAYSPRPVSFEGMESVSRPRTPPLGESASNNHPPKTPTISRRHKMCYDMPESSKSTLIGSSPATEGTCAPTPPWMQSTDPPSPPSVARAPSKSDTHSWRTPEPRMDAEVSPVLTPLCFPTHSSHMDIEGQAKKPKLPVAPPVWAQSRQELCESLPYFRSYQGGVYTRQKKAVGYLLDGHPAARDLWHSEGKLIISHGGGNSAVDKDTKQTVLVNDQTGSSVSCAGLMNSYKTKQPIALIAGNGYNLFPYDLEHRSYVVLGYYVITKTWEEPEPSSTSARGYFVRRKFLFQWIDDQGEPWWIQTSQNKDLSSQGQPSADPGEELIKECPICGLKSRQIYNFGWVCTVATCPSFFRQHGQGPEGYNPKFLIPRPRTRYGAKQLRIRPDHPVDLEHYDDDRETTTRRFWSGFCCQHCGRLSCREHWTHWECSNCHKTMPVSHKAHSEIDGTLPTGGVKFEVGKHSGIQCKTKKLRCGTDTFRARTFTLPWNRGVIYVIEGNPIANASANEIFKQYQVDAGDSRFFRRYAMKSHKLKGRMLSHYFSQNSGEPYKYVGGTDNTVPIGTYKSVHKSVQLIRKRAAMALGEDPLFNEILSAAYMADQKMEFHSDGEKDLGPVVASLSLGAPAVMRFRPIPTRIKRSTSEMSEANTPKSPTVLTLTLRHGDIMIMAGAEIQEFYQHAVYPTGFRIAATARYIKTENPRVSR